MTVTRLVSALAVFAVPLAALAEDSTPMQEGLWEISMQMDIPGMPFKMPAQTTKHCYTKQEVQNQGGVPQQQKDCKATETRRTGSTVRWSVTCTGKNPGTGEGEITFKGAGEYEGTLRMTSGGTTMTSSYSARRLSDCK